MGLCGVLNMEQLYYNKERSDYNKYVNRKTYKEDDIVLVLLKGDLRGITASFVKYSYSDRGCSILCVHNLPGGSSFILIENRCFTLLGVPH